ncbi:trimeric intracellular cation channel family protein [Streptomyces albus subsp. chlorinus]|nr:trimeric intracellular cation channel family protein [Streptomyces albus subsp. chlorinus]
MRVDTLFNPTLQHWLDIAGIFVFAVSGALLAVRRNFDVFGIAVLAEVTGLGGGIFRDVVIGAVPPAAFTDLGYFLTPLVSTALVFFLHPQVERINKAVNVFDAAGLGLFCVTGTLKGHEYGLGLTSSVVMGLATAAGGGVLRDVLANEVPSLLRWDREIYAVPAIVGSSAVALLIHLDEVRPTTAVGAALLAFVLRLLALRYNWRAPRAWKRSSATLDAERAGSDRA